MWRAAAALGTAALAAAVNPPAGQFSVDQKKIKNVGFEPGSNQTERNYIVTWPTNNPGKSTLIIYAHGASGGGDLEVIYNRHFKDLAAYGFVVVAATSCDMSCGTPTGGGWQMFVWENLRGIGFAKNASADESMPWGSMIDFSRGVGFAGHSMGGESCNLASNAENAKKFDIRATVNQHGYGIGTKGAEITVPSLFFTGTDDVIVPPVITKGSYTPAPKPKSWRNQVGKGHLEMTTVTIIDYNPAIAAHTAAFFKVWIEGDKGTYYDQIYKNGTDSLCGYAKMKSCESFPSA